MSTRRGSCPRWRRALFLAFALLPGLADACAGATGVVIKGDLQTWDEIKAALTRLHQLKAYRGRGPLRGGGTVTAAFANPDRMQARFDMGNLITESIQVGSESCFRIAGGTWGAINLPTGIPNTNPEKISGQVTVARGSPAIVDGVQTQGYVYSVRINGQTVRYNLFVAVQSGMPKRLQILDAKGAVEMQLDYFDYDAPITITLPAC